MRTPLGLDKDRVLIVHMDRSMWTGKLPTWLVTGHQVHFQSRSSPCGVLIQSWYLRETPWGSVGNCKILLSTDCTWSDSGIICAPTGLRMWSWCASHDWLSYLSIQTCRQGILRWIFQYILGIPMSWVIGRWQAHYSHLVALHAIWRCQVWSQMPSYILQS